MPNERITCPHCEGGERLEFIPMLEGAIYAQCPCGYGWELKPAPLETLQ